MKVLILATDLLSRGGIARYTSTLASSLASTLGSENVDVLCFFDWGYAGELPTEFHVLGMVSGRGRAGVLSRLNFLFQAAKAATRGYDLVIANHVALAPVAALMKLAFRTPYWVACHSVEVWWGTSPVRHAALKRADLILPVSRYTADAVQKMDGIHSSRVKVVYNAIPDSLARLLLSQEPHSDLSRKLKAGTSLLLSVCSLVRGNEFKGVDTVIRALPKILKTKPDLRYLVVGEGEIRPRLERLAVEMGVAENVTFLGEVSDAELAELYRLCDVFVLPSRGQEPIGTTGGEGFGRVYVEAALAGKPVIGSLSGGAAEAVLHGKTGVRLNADSSDEVADAVLTILQNHRAGSYPWVPQEGNGHSATFSEAGTLQVSGRIVADLQRREKERTGLRACGWSAMTKLMKQLAELPQGFSRPTALPATVDEERGWQHANRSWWESHPMRYDWKDGIPYEEFSKEFFEEIDRRFFSAVELYAPCKKIPFDWLIDFESLRTKDVLEIGVGNGSHAQLLAEHAQSFTGIDLTEYAVKSTSERMRVFRLAGTVAQMDAEHMQLPDNSADLVWSWGVIHHSANTRRILEEIHRVLRPGGEAIVMVYHRTIWEYYVQGALLATLSGQVFKRAAVHKTIQRRTDGAMARYYRVFRMATVSFRPIYGQGNSHLRKEDRASPDTSGKT